MDTKPTAKLFTRRKALIFASLALNNFLVWAVLPKRNLELLDNAEMDDEALHRRLDPLLVTKRKNLVNRVFDRQKAKDTPSGYDAESKNVTSSEYGLVLGTYELAALAAAPLASISVARLGFLTILNGAFTILSISTISFGFLNHVNSRTGFLSLSFVLRIIEAFGATGVMIATFGKVGYEFPGATGRVVGLLESLAVVAMAVGPVLGSALYTIGGPNFAFTLPFVTIGGLNIVAAIIANVVLSPTPLSTGTEEGAENSGGKYSLFGLLRLPSALLFLSSATVSGINLGFLLTLLEPHLRQFDLSTFTVGLLFFTFSGFFAMSTLLFGYAGDKLTSQRRLAYIPLGGLLGYTLLFLLFGPPPFFNHKSALWLDVVILICMGIAQAGLLTPSFMLTLKVAQGAGFPQDDKTCAHVSAAYLAAVSIGCFIGPSLAGFLNEDIGFPNATVVFSGINLGWAFLLTGYLWSQRGLPRADPRREHDNDLRAEEDEGAPFPVTVN